MTKRKNKKSLVYRRWWHFESLTFNQVVRGSNPRTLIVEQAVLLVLFFPKLYMRMWRNWQTRWF
jgi:hypothetical protein